MEHTMQPSKDATSRRSFLRKGLAVGAAGTIGAALVVNGVPAFAAANSGGLTQGDAAILWFLAARPTGSSSVNRRSSLPS